MPACHWAIFMKAGFAMSKCVRGGLHHPPLFGSLLQSGGQRLVAVRVVMGDPLQHDFEPTHRSWQHCPHPYPFWNSTELNAAVSVPQPVLNMLPQPHAPPINRMNVFTIYCRKRVLFYKIYIAFKLELEYLTNMFNCHDIIYIIICIYFLFYFLFGRQVDCDSYMKKLIIL